MGLSLTLNSHLFDVPPAVSSTLLILLLKAVLVSRLTVQRQVACTVLVVITGVFQRAELN